MSNQSRLLTFVAIWVNFYVIANIFDTNKEIGHYLVANMNDVA